MLTQARRIGILAGGGSLPREIADCASRRGNAVSIVAIDGEADADFGDHPVTRVNWGQIGAMVSALKSAGAEDLVFAGRVRRPDLLKLRPDLGFFRAIAHIGSIIFSGGDDSVLRAVIRFFEDKGLRVIGVAEAAPELVIEEGPVGISTWPAQDKTDTRLGFDVVRTLGPYDIGQGVIISNGRIEAIEGADGTDEMLKRLIEVRSSANSPTGGVLVKRTKPHQELRIDLPAIGPETVRLAAEAKLSGIAVEAGHVVTLERAKLERAIEESGVFVIGIVDASETYYAQPRPHARFTWSALNSERLNARAMADAQRGFEVLAALTPFGGSRGVVVANHHVLAVESGEGAISLLERAAGLVQWGTSRWRKAGVVVTTQPLSPEIIDEAAAASLAGIISTDKASAATDETCRRAESHGLHIGIANDRVGAAP